MTDLPDEEAAEVETDPAGIDPALKQLDAPEDGKAGCGRK